MLIGREIEYPQAIAEIKPRQDLRARNDLFLRRRARAAGAFNNRRFEAVGGDLDRLRGHAEVMADQANVVIALNERYLGLRDFAQQTRFYDRQSRRLHGLEN